MITLKRNEDIEKFQVELALKVKTYQSPFIPILILAQEQQEIAAEVLQENLLTSLPVRACENLLKRLEQQGYLQQVQNNMFGHRLKHQIGIANYSLTELGEQSAIDKSFWIGEKGVYNVYVSKSNLIQQRIIKTEKADRAENGKDNRTATLPRDIRQYENQILTINKTEVLFEDIEERCFQLQPVNCIIEIQAKENETNIKIYNGNESLFQTDFEIEENILQEELLAACSEFEYNQDKKAILTAFSKDNLSFRRKVKIGKPIFQGNQFNQVELQNISFIPSNQNEAVKWYWELLFQNINSYFLTDESFSVFASEILENFKPNYQNIKSPDRAICIKYLKVYQDNFYQIAKLDTIDYLNY